MKARSVVIIAIWPSWVSAIGAERRIVSISSVASWFCGAAISPARSILSRDVMKQIYQPRWSKWWPQGHEKGQTYPCGRSGTRVILAPRAFRRSSMRS